MSGDPFSKEQQLSRGQRRYKRKVASPKQWQAIIAAKAGPCRVCVNAQRNGHDFGIVEFHHIVPRSQGGDDVADNVLPLHAICHDDVTTRQAYALTAVEESLSDAERAYVVGKLGE